MSRTIHAFEFLAAPAKDKLPGVCAVFGDEPFLKRLVLKELCRQAIGDDADVPVAAYDCQERLPDWRDVADELATASLFGGRPRLVIVQTADDFVSAHRQRLEDYAARPRSSGILVLDVQEWPTNTRLYKALDQSGLQIDCRPPQRQRGKNKEVDEAAIVKWIVAWARSQHGRAVSPDAAQLLLDLTGPTFGLLDQSLAKLALLVPAQSKVSPQQVQEIIGGWRARSTWDMIDAASAGDAGEALTQLDRLLRAGEHPLAIAGSLSWSLRRYAAATRIFQAAERAGSRIPLRQALAQAGFRDWPPGSLAAAEKRLLQLGRHRAGRLYRWLLELDLALKGSHSQQDRARWALERLILRMAKAASPKPVASG